MTVIQIFCLSSTVMFIVTAAMLSSNNLAMKLLKAACFAMALFGAAVTASLFGFVVQV